MKEYYQKRKIGLTGTRIKKEYSVLVPILLEKGKPHLLFQVRSSKLSVQPGEISFPGGSLEGQEEPDNAALREASEELLLAPENIKILLDGDLDISYTGRIVHSYIGLIRDYHGTFNPSEVASIFTIPFELLRTMKAKVLYNKLIIEPDHDFPFDKVPGGKDYEFLQGRERMVFYEYEYKLIWGLTARILESSIPLIEKYIL